MLCRNRILSSKWLRSASKVYIFYARGTNKLVVHRHYCAEALHIDIPILCHAVWGKFVTMDLVKRLSLPWVSFGSVVEQPKKLLKGLVLPLILCNLKYQGNQAHPGYPAIKQQQNNQSIVSELVSHINRGSNTDELKNTNMLDPYSDEGLI